MKRPALYILIPFCAGIWAGGILNFPAFYGISIAAVSVIISLFYLKDRSVSHAALYAAIFFCGIAAYGHSCILPKDHIANFISDQGRDANIAGVILDDPAATRTIYRTYKTTFILDARSLKMQDEGRRGGLNLPYGWHSVTGLVKADIFSKDAQDLHYADEVMLEGNISKPQGLSNPGLFDYAGYLKVKGIYAGMSVKNIQKMGTVPFGDSPHFFRFFKKAAFKVRNKLESAIDEYFKMPYSGFLKAIIVGNRSGLSENLKDDFVKTGTVHVIAISGLNVGLIAAIFLAFFRLLRVPRRFNLAVTALGLIFYSSVAGSDPPIIRAVIMFCIYAAGSIVKRDTDMLNSLSIAALAILLWNPKALYDPSFQLSFMALASTILFASFVNGILKRRTGGLENLTMKAKRYALDGISVSVASWIGTAPLVAAYFNIISPISVIANFVAIPMLFLLTAASFIFFALSSVSPAFASILAHGMQYAMQVLFSANGIFADIPLAYFRIGAPSAGFVILYYALILVPLAPPEFRFRKWIVHKGVTAITILVLFNALAWWNVLVERKARGLEVTFLDVGQGDCAFLRLPQGANVLIDGGPGGENGKFDIGESVVAPFLWNRGLNSIDAVIVTHLHADHLGGLLYVLKNFKVGCVIDSGAAPETDDSGIYDEYMRTIKERRLRRIMAREGDVITSSGNPDIYVLNPARGKSVADSNDNSLVLKMAYENVIFLFCGDIKDRAMSRLNSYGRFLRSDIVKVPHHGGSLGNYAAVSSFFGYVLPEVSVISVGRRSRYGMPLEETVGIIGSTGSEICATSKNGAIEISVVPTVKGYKKEFVKKN